MIPSRCHLFDLPVDVASGGTMRRQRLASMPDPRAELGPFLAEVARAVRDAGGRAVVVGGWVRDRFLGMRSKDVDIEVFALDTGRLEALLAGFGAVHEVGRAFGVFRVGGIDVDFSLPRRDSKRGPGHRGFDVVPDPSLDFAEAARRRDLTVNSIGIDLLTGEVLDPHGGRRDLERRVLRATDPARFPEDPLRGRREAVPAAWSITTEGRKVEEHEARAGLETRLRNGRTRRKFPAGIGFDPLRLRI